MAKNLDFSMLLDFYGEMLTEKQREVAELYYNEDLSLAEIAEHSGITRQGVRDSIKRAEGQFLNYEEKLGLLARFLQIQDGIGEITRSARELLEQLSFMNQPEMQATAQRIIDIAAALDE